jgi:hypothetical protein
MIRALVTARRRAPREVPNPDRMCGSYGLLMERLFTVLPHEHTRIEVQHMLYTAQVLSIARCGQPLFQNQFIGTSDGPVIPVLWRLQQSREGLEQVMHPIHRELIDEDDHDTIVSVADRLARLDARQIAVYANSHLSAANRCFLAWCAKNGKSMKRNEEGFLGDRVVTLLDLEGEVRRRYAGRNALERADQETATQKDGDACGDGRMAA